MLRNTTVIWKSLFSTAVSRNELKEINKANDDQRNSKDEYSRDTVLIGTSVENIEFPPSGLKENGEQSSFSNPASIDWAFNSRYISNLRKCTIYHAENFPEFLRYFFAIGAFPENVITSWESYKSDCVNYLSPGSYATDQLFMTLEYEYCGRYLNLNELYSAPEIISIFKQLSYSLAVAEKAFKFEHRDLHCKNILLKHTSKTTIEYYLEDLHYQVSSEGLFVTIIDFSLSRMTVENMIHFVSLDELEISMQEKEENEIEWAKSTDIYNGMKHLIKTKWEGYFPRTNLYWLRHLLECCVHCLENKREDEIDEVAEHWDQSMKLLYNWRNIILEFEKMRSLSKLYKINNLPKLKFTHTS